LPAHGLTATPSTRLLAYTLGWQPRAGSFRFVEGYAAASTGADFHALS
jgi:hypothetical protein